mgnify:FL=1
MNRFFLTLLILIVTLSGLMAVPRELVIIEIGTGTWCPYCPGASMGAHDLLSNGYPVGVVKYHNGDSYTTAQSNARNSYYSISSFPTTLFDGMNRYVGGSNTQSLYSTFTPRVSARLNVESHYTLSATGANNGNNYMMIVNVTKPEADTNTNVVLHAALTQSNIAQNWQGQTQINNAMRLMIPDQNGTPVDLVTGEQTSIPLNFTVNASWPVQNLELVLWLQNTVTKEILQGKKYALAELQPGASVSTDFIVFPSVSINSTSTQRFMLTNYSANTVTGTISVDNLAFDSDISTFTIPALSAQAVNLSFSPTQAIPYEGILTINGNFVDSQQFDIILNGYAFNNTSPSVSELLVSGPPVLHQTLTASYTYADPENHPEGTSMYQWFRVNGNATPIQGATGLSYQLTEADIDSNIYFKVIPYDIHGLAGTEVLSTPTQAVIPLPAPQNFTAIVEEPSNVICTWQRPQYFESKSLLGYKLLRNDLTIATITDANTLSFTDTNLNDGVYEYKICSVFQNPYYISNPSPVVTITIGTSSIEDELVPTQTGISVYPNPFHYSTNFNISLKGNNQAELSIYNVKGQLVRKFDIQPDAKGMIDIVWDGRTENGDMVVNGVYFYRVHNSENELNGKVIVIK